MLVGTDTSMLITGASSGIGAALAVAAGARGVWIGLVARRERRLDEVADLARSAGAAECSVWPCDLADLDAAVELVRVAEHRFGGLDVLVNNAAIPKRVRVQELGFAQIDETMRVNFTAPVRMSLAALPPMLARDRGVIVNVSSMGGRIGITQEAAYCASKFALCGWSEAMATDLWHTSVTVRLILPGPIDTEIWDQPGNARAQYDGPLEPPSLVADGILAAIEGDTFEHYVPDLRSIVEWKTTSIDAFLASVANQ